MFTQVRGAMKMKIRNSQIGDGAGIAAGLQNRIKSEHPLHVSN